MTETLIILIVTVAMFVWGRVRSDVVALMALSALLLTGILTPAEALAGFSSSIVIMMAGLFVVGGALVQTGLAREAGNRIMSLARGSETRALLLVLLATSLIGAFVSNTGTVALMMPIVISMCQGTRIHSSRLLMPLAFAGSLGGMLTLIGTPPNLVIDETLRHAGYEGLQFFSFLPMGIVVIVIGIVVLMPMSKLLVKKQKRTAGTDAGKTLDDLVEQYQLLTNLHKVLIVQGSDLDGMTLQQAALRDGYGVTVVEVRHEKRHSFGLVSDVSQKTAGGDTVMHAGDLLYLIGDADSVQAMAERYSLVVQPGANLDFYDIGLAEVVVLPTSRLTGTRIADSRLRERYGVNVLAIRRRDDYITDGLGEERLYNGDVLLVQASWDKLMAMNSDNDDWVVMGQPDKTAGSVTLDYKAPVAAVIMMLMVVAMVFSDRIGVAPVTTGIVAALLTVLCGCFRNVEAAYKTISWQSIVLIAAMMPMSTALEKTGVSSQVSAALVGSLGALGPYALLAGIYFTTSLMTMFISNTATAVLMAPIALVAAQQTAVSPYSFLMAVTLGASMCFASPFSTPPNALVMKAGHYTFLDYVRVGLPLQVIIGIVMTVVLPLFFPF